jgi:hypothetical protein
VLYRYCLFKIIGMKVKLMFRVGSITSAFLKA